MTYNNFQMQCSCWNDPLLLFFNHLPLLSTHITFIESVSLLLFYYAKVFLLGQCKINIHQDVIIFPSNISFCSQLIPLDNFSGLVELVNSNLPGDFNLSQNLAFIHNYC